MSDLIREFRQTIAGAEIALLQISEAESTARPVPGEWSAKEILGHLIDSAANNHRRFVEAQWRDDLLFPGYDQERWVAAQQAQEQSWTALIALWKAYNLHLVHLVTAIPEDVLRQPRSPHSLDRIAWQRVSPHQLVSLEYLVRDYIGHMNAHLDQISANCSA